MNGICLKLYVQELRKHRNVLLYEWLLEQAKALGIHGGSAFRGIAGYGRHGVLHEEHFFELAGNLPVEIVFMVSENEATKIMQLLEAEGIQIFYAKLPAEYGVLNGAL